MTAVGAIVVAAQIVLVLGGLLAVPAAIVPYVVLAAFVAWLWQRKGRRALTAFFFSFAFSPLITFGIWLFMKTDRAAVEQRALAEGMKKCPSCAELVKAEATVCKNCRSDLRALI